MALKINTPTKPTNKPDYSKHLEAQSTPIVGMVSKEKKSADVQGTGPVSETQTIHPGIFTEKADGMRITVEGGRTINLGNYESARIGVTITVPCDPASLNDAYNWATDWVSERIEEALKDVKG